MKLEVIDTGRNFNSRFKFVSKTMETSVPLVMKHKQNKIYDVTSSEQAKKRNINQEKNVKSKVQTRQDLRINIEKQYVMIDTRVSGSPSGPASSGGECGAHTLAHARSPTNNPSSNHVMRLPSAVERLFIRHQLITRTQITHLPNTPVNY